MKPIAVQRRAVFSVTQKSFCGNGIGVQGRNGVAVTGKERTWDAIKS